MDWKQTFYRFIETYNQWEIKGEMGRAEAWIVDRDFLTKQRERLCRIKQRNQKNNIMPFRNESKLKIDRIKTSENKVEVTFALKRIFFYHLLEQEHVEERIETMRTQWFLSTSGKWLCRSVIVYDESEVSAYTASELYDHHTVTPSSPFLNEQLLYPSRVTRFVYDRHRVRQYANLYWDKANPEYMHFDDDCTNYVSQCIFAGGAPMNYTGRRNAGWWYKKDIPNDRWSFSWTVSHSLCWYLSSGGLHAEEVKSPTQLDVGDVIIYDFEGDSRYNHSTIVTAHDASGMPLVNAHTVNSKQRYWDYQDSYAWTKRTVYRFFHIPDRV